MNKLFVAIAFLLIATLTLVSLFYAFLLDEGIHTGNPIENFLANIFGVFRFPFHTLLWPLFDAFPSLGSSLFLPGLFFNAYFYTLVLERIIALLFQKRM